MNTKILLLLGVVTVAAADKLPRPSYSYAAPQESEESDESDESDEYSVESTEAKYDFDWSVKDEDSGNDFGHQESRDGDNTRGSYSVQLSDGRLQTVTYYVDGDSGYVAEVKYEGEAQYPESDESDESDESYEYTAPRPRYSAPEPEESVEAPVYAPPRRFYYAPDSNESK